MSEERELLVVKSKLKAFVKENGLSCAGDVADLLSLQIYGVVEDAITEAKRQKNKTLMAKHLK